MKDSDIKVVILCGGMGTRLKEETEFKPKPLVQVGPAPILWHIMKIYSHYGFKDFVLALGYRGDMIKHFFLDYDLMTSDFTLKLNSRGKSPESCQRHADDWNVTFVDTGLDTKTGGRIKKLEKHVGDGLFMATYGDGVGDVDIRKLLEMHEKKGKTMTLTGVHPSSKYGHLSYDKNDVLTEFSEKPFLNEYINGGFFVFENSIFDHLGEDEMLESKAIPELTAKREVALYRHDGFWHCMDTYKDYLELNDFWKKGAPWKMWGD